MSSRTGLPVAARDIAGRVDRRVEELLSGEVARWSVLQPDLRAPLQALRTYVTAGGKRLRPAFCYWAYAGAGGNTAAPAVVDAAAALEMLHTAALVHDDIIDMSERRHGVESVHVALAAEHRRSGWRGDADRFGEAAAIITGDLALVLSSRLMAGAPAPALALFEEMRIEVNVGQYLDIVSAAAGLSGSAQDTARASAVCRYKTAKYTVERPMHIGAALAAPERLPELAAPISAFALPLGEAFQLRDDLLGVFGDPLATGKPVGEDLREGKATVLAALAASRGDQADRRRFAALLGSDDLGEDGIAAMTGHIERSGARAEVEEAIARLLGEAAGALERLPLERSAIEALGELSAFVAGRDR